MNTQRLTGLLVSLAVALSTVAIAAPPKDVDVAVYGLGHGQKRYSPLNEINRGNVRDLVPVWNLSLDNPGNIATQPLVVNGVMYVATHEATVAIDAITGRQK